MPFAIEIPKKKKPNYFTNYSGFTDPQVLSVLRGGVTSSIYGGMRNVSARIASFSFFIGVSKMRRVQLFQKAAACVALLVFMAGQVQAAVITFDLAWSGVSFGNSASAVGTISLDDSLLLNPGTTGFSVPLAPTVTALSITVSGAVSGNGTFTMSDFSGWVFETGGATLNLNSQLVGQSTLGNPWGTPDSVSGDFNLFSTVPGGPFGFDFFTLATDGGSGNLMLLTSFSPQTAAVPEPTSVAIFGIGAGFMSFVSNRRRRRQQKQTATA